MEKFSSEGNFFNPVTGKFSKFLDKIISPFNGGTFF